MNTCRLNAGRCSYLWAGMAMVLLGGCSREVSRMYESPSGMRQYTLKIGEIRQEKGYVYSSLAGQTGEAEQEILRLDTSRWHGEVSPWRENPLDVMRESLQTQAEGTGLFKQVGEDLPAPDYVLSGTMELLSTSSGDSLGTYMNYRALLRACLEDTREGVMVWSGEGVGATPFPVEHVVEVSSSSDGETLMHYAPWLFGWSPEAISEAVEEVMKQVVAAIAEQEMQRAKGLP